MHKNWLAILLASACSGGKQDWSQRPLSQSITHTTDHKFEYTIKLPDGLDENARLPGWWESKRGPTISVQESSPPNLDVSSAQAAALSNWRDEATVLDKHEKDGRIVVAGTTPNEVWYFANVAASKEYDLVCSVKQWPPDDQLKNPQPLLAWMESVCGSLALKQPYRRQPLPPQLVELLGQLDGQHAHVAATIAKLRDPAMVANEDLGAYDLREPRLWFEFERNLGGAGVARCFRVDAKAGATERSFDVCFTPAGRIAAIALEPLKHT
jgi:hypothetical protein